MSVKGMNAVFVVSPVRIFQQMVSVEMRRLGWGSVRVFEDTGQASSDCSHPRTILVDCMALHGRWCDTLTELRSGHPEAEIVVLGDEDEAQYSREIGRETACRYASKLEPLSTLRFMPATRTSARPGHSVGLRAR